MNVFLLLQKDILLYFWEWCLKKHLPFFYHLKSAIFVEIQVEFSCRSQIFFPIFPILKFAHDTQLIKSNVYVLLIVLLKLNQKILRIWQNYIFFLEYFQCYVKNIHFIIEIGSLLTVDLDLCSVLFFCQQKKRTSALKQQQVSMIGIVIQNAF
eukprot:TRINITY_DN6949_c0_g2_i1.p1 TRINITY_DN6949_c0_g2~~TRINITY_DN6949_c0_g2_i1.p1  ORF type:complete len:153 (+),score=3.07 TRINITY_DN6949_c0_g2_i1:242-700(+)